MASRTTENSDRRNQSDPAVRALVLVARHVERHLATGSYAGALSVIRIGQRLVATNHDAMRDDLAWHRELRRWRALVAKVCSLAASEAAKIPRPANWTPDMLWRLT